METTTNNQINLNAAGFAAQQMEVSRKEDGKYVPVGKVTYYVPTLASLGFAAEEGPAEDGLPTYKDDKAQWLFNAVHAATKAKVRNSLISGTAELKPGLSIPEDFEALLAEGVRGGTGEALAIVRELKKAFAAYVAKLGKSSAAQDVLNKAFADRAFLALQTQANKDKISAYIAEFAEGLEAELLERGQRYLQSLLDAASANEDEDPFASL